MTLRLGKFSRLKELNASHGCLQNPTTTLILRERFRIIFTNRELILAQFEVQYHFLNYSNNKINFVIERTKSRENSFRFSNKNCVLANKGLQTTEKIMKPRTLCVPTPA